MQLRARRPIVVLAAVAAAAVLLVAAAKGAARVTEDPVVWGLAGWVIPGDFWVFLGAGDAVRAGESPYPTGALAPPPAAYYVYPPPLALVVAPLAALPHTHASSIWTVLGIAAVIGALLVLGVRDWRCHALALLSPYTHEALEYGAIGTFLTLLVAVAWRYRDRLPAATAATAGAVVLKLFLWPLVVWHALAGRIRTAAAAAVAAAGVALASWAALGFAGLTGYPGLLGRLTELEAAETYSLYALGRALDAPAPAAQLAAVLAGAALLAAAFLVSRRRSDGAAERRALILVLAAAFALTPILWLHYFVLLAVPIALASPRFSALWLLPLTGIVFYALGWYGGWAYRDVPAIASALGVATVTLAASYAAVGREPVRLRRLIDWRPAQATR